jgi:predicted nucleotidyltransferase
MDGSAPFELPEMAGFCRRWAIQELALFGSALRPGFGPGSDIDLLVTFHPEAEWSLLDHVRIQTELSELLGRPVDLVSRRAIDRSANALRRREILGSAKVVYAA